VEEVEQYQPDRVGFTSSHSTGSRTKLLEKVGLCSGVAQGERRRAGVGILTSPQRTRGMPTGRKALTVCAHAPNRSSESLLGVGRRGQCCVGVRNRTGPLDWQTRVVVPKRGPKNVLELSWYHTTQPPGESLRQGAERSSDRWSNLRFKTSSVGSVPLMEPWTSSLPSQPVYMCFVDLEKVFDQVPLGLL